MGSNNSSDGFEYYKNKKTETVFETFLRYTNQKEKSASLLAELLEEKLERGSSVLDIGAGTGEFLKLALLKVKDLPEIDLTLIEPSDELVKQLYDFYDDLVPSSKVYVSHSEFAGFSSDEQFDLIIASHLFYHLPKDTWGAQFTKMLSFLKPDGKLIIVQREKDDAYAFKMQFKPLIFGEAFKSILLGDVMATLPNPEKLRVTRRVAASEIRFPITSSMDDTESIIEFYFSMQWSGIPEGVRKGAMDYLKKRDGVLQLLDGFAIIEKLT